MEKCLNHHPTQIDQFELQRGVRYKRNTILPSHRIGDLQRNVPLGLSPQPMNPCCNIIEPMLQYQQGNAQCTALHAEATDAYSSKSKVI
jgi:hypothetical protein